MVVDIAKGQSERERVMDYLWVRTKDAFRWGNNEEAQGCHRFLTVLEGLSDDEYHSVYSEHNHH